MGRVVVVGGGLAGSSAALALAEAGAEVVLFEKRRGLGGRACSFRPAGWSTEVDNSQHVLLRCCTHLLDLYQRLGMADTIDWHDRVTLVAPDGRRGAFSAWPLPPPLHLAPALVGIPGLAPGDRLKLALAFQRMLLAGRRYRMLDGTFAAWLGGSSSATLDEGFWRLMLTSVLNAGAERIGAAYGLMFFLEGLMRHRTAFHLGVPRASLDELHDRAMRRALEARGVTVRLGERAAITWDGQPAVQVGGETLSCEHAVSAVPWPHVGSTVPAAAVPAGAAGLAGEAIVGVHLAFAEPVLAEPVVGLLRHDVDWVFGLDGGRRLSVVVSDARSWAGLSPEAMAARALAGLRAVWPDLPEPVATAACREVRATFVPVPGVDALRPGPATPLAGVWLAGEWTATRWPSTMEAAVRSGNAVAEAITGRPPRVGDLPRQGLLRWALPR